MKIKKLFGCLAVAAMVLTLAPTPVHAEEGNVAKGTQKVVVLGDDWGPAVTKTIISFDKAIDASSLQKEDFSVIEEKISTNWGETDEVGFGEEYFRKNITREVEKVYLSDESGNEISAETGKIVTLEMYVSPNDGSPFIYSLSSGFNRWCEDYYLIVSLTEEAEITSEGTKLDNIDVESEIDLYDENQRICIIADDFEQHTYVAKNGDSYIYGEFSPAKDDKQNALVIWLHGAGEGQNAKGSIKNDNYIDLLGNEVTALAREEFQSLFGGAYVITPQAPTMWMDDGEGNYQYGDPGSCYTESLMELIKTYVANNKDVDPNRIIIGGCSNGGYMTMQMILEDPTYFAAAYPICEAYSDEFITDDQIKALADSGMGIWFTYAKTDTTVDYSICTVPTYNRLKAAGANVHMSSYDNVIDLTGRFINDDGIPHEYNGHWSWIYFDNNNNVCDECGENEWKFLASAVKKVEQPVVTEEPSKAVETADTAPIVMLSVLALASAFVVCNELKKRKA